MKLTVELPDDLLLQARRKAHETGTTIRDIIERALRRELMHIGKQAAHRYRRIRWVTSALALPPQLDVSDRTRMWAYIQEERGYRRH
jgi:hypothetical protein